MDKMSELMLNWKIGQKPRIIEEGQYHGYNYYIIYSRLCPCAYVEIPRENRLYEKSYSLVKLSYTPNWGFTYGDNYLKILGGCGTKKKWYLGWDYGHCTDYSNVIHNEGRVWTTKDIREECMQVIDAIIKYNCEPEGRLDGRRR